MTPPPAAGPKAPALDRPKLFRDLTDEVTRFGGDEGRAPRFDELYAHAKERHPALTPAEFKAAVKKLDADGHLALSGWNESTDRVPDEALNLYHHGGDEARDADDMLYYHANPAAWHGATPKTASPEASAPAAPPEAPPPAAKPKAARNTPAPAKPPPAAVTPDALAADPGADRRTLTALAQQHPEGSKARDHLESAAHNLHGDDTDVDPTARRRDTVKQIAELHRAAHKAGDTETAGHLAAALPHFGAGLHGPEEGTQTAFDGRYHESEHSAFTGDAVTVLRRPVVLGEHVAVKGKVKKA